MPILGLNKDITEDLLLKENKSIVPLYDSERVNDMLLVTLPGTNWEVTYFHRQIDNTSLSTQYDPNLDITLQNLVRLNNFIIKVESPLGNTSSEEVSGTGIIDINIIPTPNDIFMSKAPDGRIIIFTITSIKRLNYNNENIFNIEYTALYTISDIDDTRYSNILAAVVETMTYNKDYRITKTKPLYTLEETTDRTNYLNYIDKLLNHWSSSFITSNTNFYIGYKYDNKNYFDPYMERFITDIIGVTNLSNSTEILSLDKKELSILDYTNKSDLLPSRISKYTNNIISTLSSDPYITGILYSGSFNSIIGITDVIDDTIATDDRIVNVIFPYVNNKNYIFRDSIYKVLNGDTLDTVLDTLTVFERVYLNMITGSTINKDDIKTIYDNIFKLGDREQFYFIPIFIYILKYYLMTFTVKFV